MWSFSRAAAQIKTFPYIESFESAVPPLLPAGWSSSRNKGGGNNDFTTSAGTSHSGAQAVLATNATIAQELVSPILDFSGRIADRLSFYVRRSTSFRAPVVVEASRDSGRTFSIPIGDTLHPSGSTGYTQSSILLPRELSGSPDVSLCWRVIPDVAGTTGTIRFDDIGVTARPAADLGLRRIRCIPALPTVDDPLTAFVTICNYGERADRPVSVYVCRDGNGDSTAQGTEVIGWGTIPAPIPASDSLELQVPLGCMTPGEALLIAVLNDSLDQDSGNDTVRHPLFVGYRRGSLVINEIMYAPASPEPEWVELTNARVDSVDLRNWSLSDAEVATRHTIVRRSVVVPPGGFALLARDSAAVAEVHPDICVPLLSVAGFPSLNNGGDAVVVYDGTGRCMDSVVYVPGWGGASAGRSLERMDVDVAADQARNWGSSKDSSGSTAGRRNSIVRKEYDLALRCLRFIPANPTTGEIIGVIARAENPGRQTVDQAWVDFFLDSNNDSICVVGEMVGAVPVNSPLRSFDSIDVAFSYRMGRSGEYRFFARVRLPSDQDSSNDGTTGVVTVHPPAGAIRINEVLYNPTPGAPEWIELVNVTGDTISLAGWKVGNHSVSSRYQIPTGSSGILPGDFLVISKDTTSVRQIYGTDGKMVQIGSLPTYCWSNGGDAVVVSDTRGRALDSIWYSPMWGGSNGISLERLDPFAASLDSANWQNSDDSCGATPGRRNSKVVLTHDLRAGCLHGEWMSGDAAAVIALVVHNAGKIVIGSFSVELFEDVDGDSLVEEDHLVSRVGVTGTLSVRDSVTVLVRWGAPGSGIHRMIAVVDSPGDERPSNNLARCTFVVPFAPRAMVVNEIMYDPRPGGAEYVEFLNASDQDIDIAGWSVTDKALPGGGSGRIEMPSKSMRVRRGRFFTVAADSGFFRSFPALRESTSGLLWIGGWSGFGLNNSGDEIVIRDPAGAVMDSVSYFSGWHRSNIVDASGRSLERIQGKGPSNDMRNWSTCVNPRGGTPSEQNSILVEQGPPGLNVSCSPNPFSPDGDGREDFSVVRYAIPVSVASVNIRIFDVKGRCIRWLANNQPSGARGEVIWDGCDDERRQVRMGVYIILLEGSDERGNAVYSTRCVGIVAGRL